MLRISPLYLFPVLGMLIFSGCGGNSEQAAFHKGIEAYKEKDFAKAITLLSKAEKRIKNSTELYYYLGASYLAEGKLDAAYAAFNIALDNDSSHGETLAGIGEIAFIKNEIEKSRGFFKQALISKLKTPEAKAMILNGLSLICRQQKNESRALVYLFQALKAAPEYAPTHYNLGHIYLNTYHLNKEALEQFNQFLKLEKKGSVHYDKAKKHANALAESIKEEEETHKVEQEKIVRNPKKAQSLLEKAMGYQAEKRYSLASRTFANALKEDPICFNAAWGWGITAMKQALRVDALRAFQRAIAIKPDFIDAYVNGAEQAFLMRRYDQAREILSPAMAKDPLYPPTFELLIKISYAQKNADEVKELGEYYLSLLRPDDPNYAKYKNWLKDI